MAYEDSSVYVIAAREKFITGSSLFVMIAVATSYFSDRYSIYFDVSMARNILKTDAAESRELLTFALLRHVLLYGLIPVALIWALRVRRTTRLRAIAVALGSTIFALLLVVGAALVSFKDISALMRDNRELRHLVTLGNVIVSLGHIAAKDLSPGASDPRRVDRTGCAPDLARIRTQTARAGAGRGRDRPRGQLWLERVCPPDHAGIVQA